MGVSQKTTLANRGESTKQNPNSVANRTAAAKKAEEAAAAAAKRKAEAEAKAKADAEARAAAERRAKTEREANPLYGLNDQQLAEYGKNAAIEKRFGGEFSWLDDAFKMNPATLGKSAAAGAKADPNAVAAQWLGLGMSADAAKQSMNFSDPALQQAIASEWQLMQNGGGMPGFEGGARQQEQYNNLRDIIAGGGATSIEMADRARQRADSESWLRGQREADLAEYAERGLSGSGMELLALASDRQAAAGRNSLGDLEMAKALEERRLGAINDAGSLAGKMREGDYLEKKYTGDRSLDALKQRTDLQTKMRDQQLAEQKSQADARQQGIDSYNKASESLRTNSFDESYKTGNAADDFAKYNADVINESTAGNVDFLRDQYAKTQNNKIDRWKFLLQNKLATAEDLLAMDQKENLFGSASATEIAGFDTAAWNKARDAYNATMGSAANPTPVVNAQANTNSTYADAGGVLGRAADTLATSGASAAANAPAPKTAATTSAATGTGIISDAELKKLKGLA